MRLVVCLTMYLMPILANAAQTKDRRRSKTAAARGCQGVAQHGRPSRPTGTVSRSVRRPRAFVGIGFWIVKLDLLDCTALYKDA